MSRRYYHTGAPYLMKDKIMDLIPVDIMVSIQREEEKYMRLKLTPAPEKEVIDNIRKNCGVTCEVYNNEKNTNCILEIGLPLYDIICNREINNITMNIDWKLEIIHNLPEQGYECIGVILYDEKHPYGLQIAEDLIDYLTRNHDMLNNIEYDNFELL